MSSTHNRFRPHGNKIAPIIGLVVILALAFGFFKFLSGDGVMDTTREGTYTGYATVLDKDTRNKKCALVIRREDGVKETRSIGWRNDCGKYNEGQQVHFTQGLIDD